MSSLVTTQVGNVSVSFTGHAIERFKQRLAGFEKTRIPYHEIVEQCQGRRNRVTIKIEHQGMILVCQKCTDRRIIVKTCYPSTKKKVAIQWP